MRKALKTLIPILMVVIVIASMLPTAFAAEQTEVNVRLVMRSHLSYAACSVTIQQYADATSNEEIPDGAQIFSIMRESNWEQAILLSPGFYEVTYVGITGDWKVELTGASERFEVKGDKMTVYVAVDSPEKPAQMPPNWLVYGEDEQNFGIWDPNAEDPIFGNPDTTTPPTETTPPEPGELPTPDTDVSEGEGPNRNPEPPPVEGPSISDEPITEKPSVKIGNIFFVVIAFGILGVCIILLRKVQKERGA